MVPLTVHFCPSGRLHKPQYLCIYSAWGMQAQQQNQVHISSYSPHIHMPGCELLSVQYCESTHFKSHLSFRKIQFIPALRGHVKPVFFLKRLQQHLVYLKFRTSLQGQDKMVDWATPRGSHTVGYFLFVLKHCYCTSKCWNVLKCTVRKSGGPYSLTSRE